MSLNLKTGKIGFVENVDDIPENAVILTQSEVLDVQNKVIADWKPARFVLKYGSELLGAVAGLSGLIYGNNVRHLMLVRNRGRLVSLGPAVFFPFMLTSLAHRLYVAHDLRLGVTQCPLCLQIRATSIQLVSGVIQPFFLAVLSSSAMAKLGATYPLPPLSDFRCLLKVYANLLKPLKSVTFQLIAANIMLALTVTYTQERGIQRVNEHIYGKETNIS